MIEHFGAVERTAAENGLSFGEAIDPELKAEIEQAERAYTQNTWHAVPGGFFQGGDLLRRGDGSSVQVGTIEGEKE